MTTTTGRLSMEQIARLAAGAGFPAEQIPTAVAVAWAESGGNPAAANTTLNANGSRDDGLWQINSVHGYDPTWLHNPANNAAAAARIWSAGGWDQWTGTYAKGAHRRYLPAARAATAATLGTSSTPFQGVAGSTGDDDTPAWDPRGWADDARDWRRWFGADDDEIGGAGKAAGAVVRDLFNLDDLWRQVLSVGLSLVFTVAGLALVALGLFRLTGNNPADIYKKGSAIAGPVAAVI